MKGARHIAVLVDGATVPEEDPDFSTHGEHTETEYHVVGALRALGHRVSVVAVGKDVGHIVRELEQHTPDLAFNLTEEFRGDRANDRNIAGLLELMGVPFTGSGPLGLSICRDKALCKRLLNAHRIRVPQFFAAPSAKPVRVPKGFPYPAVVKPLLGDGSDGISNASLVDNEDRLRERVAFVHDRMKQVAIVEEFIAGRELYVAVLGNSRLRVFPPREVFLRSEEGNGAPRLSTYHVKFDEQYQEKWGIRFGFAELDAGELSRLARICRRAYRVLRIRDYGRIDVRMTAEGQFVILEANPNPDLAWGDEVAESAEKAGVDYERLINAVLHASWRRYGQ